MENSLELPAVSLVTSYIDMVIASDVYAASRFLLH